MEGLRPACMFSQINNIDWDLCRAPATPLLAGLISRRGTFATVTRFHPNHVFHAKVLVRLQAEASWELRGSSALIRKDPSQVAGAPLKSWMNYRTHTCKKSTLHLKGCRHPGASTKLPSLPSLPPLCTHVVWRFRSWER